MSEDAASSYGAAVSDVIGKALVASMLSVAHELGVLRLLIDSDTPLTSQEIADRRNLKERYVREAMNSLASADIVGVAKNSDDVITYHLTAEQGAVLQGPHTMMLGVLASQATRYSSMIECFKKDGPHGLSYSDDPWTQKSLQEMMDARVDVEVDLVLDVVPGVVGRFESGMSVIEFGSGSGGFTAGFAQRFPKTTFVASEYTEDATDKLRSKCQHLQNINCRRLDLLNIPEDLIGQFDFALVNDVIHDTPDPLGSLQGYYKVLKPGSYFAMVDIDGSSDVTVNKAQNPGSSALYAVSTFHCVAQACQGPDSTALGACWGRDVASRLITEAGFTLVSQHPHLGAFVLYICLKH